MGPEQKKIKTLKIVWSIIAAVLLAVVIVFFSIPATREKKTVLAHEGYVAKQTEYITEYEILLFLDGEDVSVADATVRFYDGNGKLLEEQDGCFYADEESMSAYMRAFFSVHGEVASYEIVENSCYADEGSAFGIIGALCVPLLCAALAFWASAMFFVKEYHYTCGERKFTVYLGNFHHHVRVDGEIFDGNMNFLSGVWQVKHEFENGDLLFVSVSGLNRVSFIFNGFVYESDEELGKAALVTTEQAEELPVNEEFFGADAEEKPAPRSAALPPMSVQPPDAEIKKVRKERLSRGLTVLGMVLVAIICIAFSAFPAKGVTLTDSRGYINARYEQTIGGMTNVRTEYEVDLRFSEEVDGGEVQLAFYDKDGNLLERVTDLVIWQDFEGVYVIYGDVASFEVESYWTTKLSWLIIPACILLYIAIIFVLPFFLLSLMHKTAKFEYEGREITVYARNSLRYVKVNGRKYYEDNTVRFGEKHIRVTLADGETVQITCSGVNTISAKIGERALPPKKQ